MAVFQRACISAEFRAMAANRSSPVTQWLRALARLAHQECGGPGVGAIGMCFTGNFTLTIMLEPSVLAPVLSQPSLPLNDPAGLEIAPEGRPVLQGRALCRLRGGARRSLRRAGASGQRREHRCRTVLRAPRGVPPQRRDRPPHRRNRPADHRRARRDPVLLRPPPCPADVEAVGECSRAERSKAVAARA